MNHRAGSRLEQYTLKRPQELLIVSAQVAGEPDQVVIFKGYSSSLMRQTAFDPDVPVLPEAATILSIDRLEGPYDPSSPRYLERGLSWADFQVRLAAVGD